jgi:F-type H+-transporting ATPase subunit b
VTTLRRRGRIVSAVSTAILALVMLAGVGVRIARADEPQAEAAAATAEGEDHHEGASEHAEEAPSINGKKFALQLLNFGVLLAILIKFGGSAVNKALASRHEQLKAEVAAASEARAQAEARLRKQDERLAGLEREIANMRAGIKAEAEVEKAHLIAAAEERAKRIREETAFVVEQQIKEAQVALRREVADSALRIAEDTLRRGVTPEDQRRMVEGFMSEVVGPEPLVPSVPTGKGI